MLSLFLLCTLSMALTSAKTTIPLSADIVALLVEKSVECAAETGADEDLVQRVLNWHLGDNETSKKFSFCLLSKAGYCNEAGYFDKDKILALYEKSDMKESVSDAFDYCNKLNGNTPFETMYRSLLCFYERSPVLVQVKI